MSDTTLNIQQNEAQNRFSVNVDGHLCVVDYQLQDATLTILHTVVPQEVGGRGIASALTQYVLDTARARQWRVVPQCSYAAAYIARHPAYQDLVA
jgi:predicted GNAT family acetyltransferase